MYKKCLRCRQLADEGTIKNDNFICLDCLEKENEKTLEEMLKDITPENSHKEQFTDLVGKEDQAWFWTKEWQEGEREAEEDIKNGRVKSFSNVHDLIAELDSEESEKWANSKDDE
jgi:hypothetical protein